MTEPARAFEAYLARLYTDAEERARFLLDPRSAAVAAGLDGAAASALAQIDRDGLELAARSFARKRAHAAPARKGLFAVATRWLRRAQLR